MAGDISAQQQANSPNAAPQRTSRDIELGRFISAYGVSEAQKLGVPGGYIAEATGQAPLGSVAAAQRAIGQNAVARAREDQATGQPLSAMDVRALRIAQAGPPSQYEPTQFQARPAPAKNALQVAFATQQFGQAPSPISFMQNEQGRTVSIITGQPMSVIAESPAFAGRAANQPELNVQTTQQPIPNLLTGRTSPPTAYASLREQPALQKPSPTKAQQSNFFDILGNTKPEPLVALNQQAQKAKDLNTQLPPISSNDKSYISRTGDLLGIKILSNLPLTKLEQVGKSLQPFETEVLGFGKGLKDYALAVPQGLGNIGGLIFGKGFQFRGTTTGGQPASESEILTTLAKPQTQAALITGALIIPEVAIPSVGPYLTTLGTGLFGVQAVKQFVAKPSGETLAGVVVAGAGFLPSVAKVGRRVAYGAIGEYVPPETVFEPTVLRGEAQFPFTKSPEYSLQIFESVRTDKGIPVVHTTEGGFGSQLTPEGNVLIEPGPAARKGLEDAGLYVTPYGKGSPYFTKVAGPERLPLPSLIPRVPSPEIVLTTVQDVSRQPESVLRQKGFESTNEFLQGQAGTRTAFITKRSESAFRPELAKTLPKGTQGTVELEAVLPLDSQLRELQGQTFLQKLTGIDRYTKFRGEVIRLREFELLGEKQIKTVPSEKEPITTSEFKELSIASASSIRDLSSPTFQLLGNLSPSSRPQIRLRFSTIGTAPEPRQTISYKGILDISSPISSPSLINIPSRPSSPSKPISDVSNIPSQFSGISSQSSSSSIVTSQSGLSAPSSTYSFLDTNYDRTLRQLLRTPSGFTERTGEREKRIKIFPKYAPSLIGISLGKKAKGKQLLGEFTGLEVRGVPVSKKKFDLAEVFLGASKPKVLKARKVKGLFKVGDFKIKMKF